MAKPEPKPLQVVCSLCGMDWEAHGEKPTAEKCVELLKVELAKRPRYLGTSTTTGIAWPLNYSQGGWLNG